MQKDYKINPIKKGLVLDHLPPGTAIKILKILGLSDNDYDVISFGMNVPTNKQLYGKSHKDIIKIENRELAEDELNKITLVAYHAHVSIIKDYEIKKKIEVKIPPSLEGILNCANINCITNKNTSRDENQSIIGAPEPISTKFDVITEEPLKIKCFYCDRDMTGREYILNHLKS